MKNPPYNNIVRWISFVAGSKGDWKMYRKYIQAVEPLDDFVLLIDFTSGSRLLLDMKPHLDSIRFRSLKHPEVWKSAETNGVFVRFGSVELSHDELMAMAEQGRHAF